MHVILPRWLAILGAVWLVETSCTPESEVRLNNQTGAALYDVHIEAGGVIGQTALLARDSEWRFQVSPRKDGCFRLRARKRDGRIVTSSCVGYTTPNDPSRHVLTVWPDGELTHRSAP